MKDSASLYWLRSRSAFYDYIRYAPDFVKALRAKPEIYGELTSELARQNLDWPVELKFEAPLKDQGPFQFGVRIEPQNEEGLWAHLEKKSIKDVMILDHVIDPHNVGAIVRTAAFFGIQTLIVPKNRQALLSEGVVQSSQAGLALVRFFAVSNISRILRGLKDQHFWIMGATMEGQALHQVDLKFPKRALVMGNEKEGLSKLTRELCDLELSIPRGQEGFDSLNVSVAAGILIHAFKVADSV